MGNYYMQIHKDILNKWIRDNKAGLLYLTHEQKLELEWEFYEVERFRKLLPKGHKAIDLATLPVYLVVQIPKQYII